MRIASSTRRPSERTRENSERKLRVCPASLSTTNVRRKTSGIVRVGTSACLNPIKSKSVPQTRISVMMKSRVSELRSHRICSEKSVVVCTTTSAGIRFDSCIFLRVACPSSTRSMIDQPDFFTTESVTAGTGFPHSIESLDSLSRFLGDS